MKIGDIYHVFYCAGGEFIFRINRIIETTINVDYYIDVNRNSFEKTDNGSVQNDPLLTTIKPATFFEKKWLLQCIEEESFIPKDKIYLFQFGR